MLRLNLDWVLTYSTTSTEAKDSNFPRCDNRICEYDARCQDVEA